MAACRCQNKNGSRVCEDSTTRRSSTCALPIFPGLWHHISYPIEQLTEASFEEGFGIDGSSIRGWAAIHESDMLLKPDANFSFA